MAKSTKRVISRGYIVISTIAFSAWLLFVASKLVMLAGHFVTVAFNTIIHSIPLLG